MRLSACLRVVGNECIGLSHARSASSQVADITKRCLRHPARGFNSKIILIDGERLASLMVDHDVGVAAVGVYKLKRIDSDYFEGE